jgi:hypothetical protein
MVVDPRIASSTVGTASGALDVSLLREAERLRL